MDALLCPCLSCKQLKPLGELNLRVKEGQYGKKGEPTSRCGSWGSLASSLLNTYTSRVYTSRGLG
jgi:hypothetical protein